MDVIKSESEIITKIRNYNKVDIFNSYCLLVNKAIELSGYEENYFLETRERNAVKWKFSIWTILRREYNCSYEYIAKISERNYSTVRRGILMIEDALKYPNFNKEFLKAYQVLSSCAKGLINHTKFEDFDLIVTNHDKIEKWLINNQIEESEKFRLLTSLNIIKI